MTSILQISSYLLYLQTLRNPLKIKLRQPGVLLPKCSLLGDAFVTLIIYPWYFLLFMCTFSSCAMFLCSLITEAKA
jgi:hypothetical protein